MTIPRADLPGHLGQWVTVSNPSLPASWYGCLLALADAPSVILALPGGGQATLPQGFTVTPAEPPPPGAISPRRQAAYDAVYDVIGSLGQSLPSDTVHRNAAIWRAVNAALDAAGVQVRANPAEPDPAPGDTLPPPGDTQRRQDALDRIQAIPRLPHASERTGVQGRAYTRGWQSVIALVDNALAGDAVPVTRDTVEDTALAAGGHVRTAVPGDGLGCDLTSGVPARPHPEDTRGTGADTPGDTRPDGVRFAYRATVRRGQVHEAITEAFGLLDRELHPDRPGLEEGPHGE
ncbi:hypothetical protein QEH48_gp087 [Streptomyces phage TurkishDelight]|uniref:Uncharacterized protein n=1 Tax=Streptomyces phage TurkishDelight TaxID=2793708 RepID=A0A7T0M127_9CAUD|nr:hypothetical protein QEH48_gp087 [Streptomyces phage TurkishDelight]QPL14116.1 hypothetical protein SEA_TURKISHDELIGHT_87 [Streptomyces phage TurkishDelight]